LPLSAWSARLPEVPVTKLEQLGIRAVAVRADVTDENDVRAGVAHAARALQGLDGLVNAAGISPFCSFADMTLDEWRRVLSINLDGARTRDITRQFLLEAMLQAGAGGLAGVVLGAAITVGYAINQGWPIDMPASGLAGGVLAALLIGGLAGLYPAGRAARVAPAEAVRTT
jgi:NAD(P)-dependent dehydrogenase (short-subunit alcohol dehydrogenase family)